MQTTKSINHIIGISAYYHDSAAALITNGAVAKAASEERFSRKKGDPAFPKHALQFCLADIDISDVSAIAYYEKPFLKFERLIETQMAFAPLGFKQFRRAAISWATEKLFLKSTLKKTLTQITGLPASKLPPLLFTQHHQAHAASAFFCSPFKKSAVLCIDGVGEWATTSAWLGEDSQLQPLWQINFPHSLGLLYSTFTQFCGFEVNTGEYKLMGLAPYGEPKYVDLILNNLIDVKADGTFRLNTAFFGFCTGLEMVNSRFEALFGHTTRQANEDIEQFHMDAAASIQKVTETVVTRLAETLKKETGCANLCLAGGVALNCVANGHLRRSQIFDNLWVQPAAGDSGGALGAAIYAWEHYYPSLTKTATDGMSNCLLGPGYDSERIFAAITDAKLNAERLNWDELYPELANLLNNGLIVAWFQGRSEFGPRALGSRSILADARSTTMQKRLNLKIKNRESFRPFAPLVLAEQASKYFDTQHSSPHMSFVEYVAKSQLKDDGSNRTGLERVNDVRSTIPAVTHLDNSARLQTVTLEQNEKLHHLLSAFYAKSGCPVLINTSFNVRDEPIVETPEDAIRCFLSTEIDILVMGQFVVRKT